MNILKTKTALFAGIALFCGVAQMINGSQAPLGNYDRFISQVTLKKDTRTSFQRIFIMPYTSTGVGASMKQIVQEAPGVTLNGIRDYSIINGHANIETLIIPADVIIKLTKPILINITTNNPELLVRVQGPGFQKKTFKEDAIAKLGKDNELIIDGNKESDKRIVLKQISS